MKEKALLTKDLVLPLILPKEVSSVIETLKKASYEAYLVGGCVRDLLIGKKPKDWDIATNALPDQIISLFEKTFYENSFGTVGVVNEILPKNEKGEDDLTLKVIEVTPFRLEAEYSDGRRPDSVTFSKKFEDDLQRRDFTINAMALSIKEKATEKGKVNGENLYESTLIDLYKGREDLKNKIVKAVGDPDQRFKEDALRLLRAVRIACEIDFSIEKETEKALKMDSSMLAKISTERIRDEFSRIIMSHKPLDGINMLHSMGLLRYIIPELELAIGIDQNQAHAYNVWQHLLLSLQTAADKKWPLDIRLAALLHDISKPETRRWSEEKKDWTFYNHEVVGSRVAKKILTRLKYPNELIEKVGILVRWHMFFTDTEQITLSAVRRMVSNVGKENIWDLMNVRICDRVGTGRPKENPYRLRKYHSMIEEAMRDPISVGMLKIKGETIMKATGIAPGPKIGFILHALLEEVLEDPKLNTAIYLEERAKILVTLPEKELKKLGEKGKEKKENVEEESVDKIRKKYWVK
jgi:poly(A) polymerase/tRNA nucleotidyltransferase (CCA-adding enzyme)